MQIIIYELQKYANYFIMTFIIIIYSYLLIIIILYKCKNFGIIIDPNSKFSDSPASSQLMTAIIPF
jgi:hypothetical protein